MDSGQDETHNPFSNVSDEYVAQKEEAIAKKQFKRISAQQRQINKVFKHFRNNSPNNFSIIFVITFVLVRELMKLFFYFRILRNGKQTEC